VYALVPILIEVDYLMSIIKQSQAYCKQCSAIPFYSEGRPNIVKSLCMLNIERVKLITKLDIHEILGEYLTLELE